MLSAFEVFCGLTSQFFRTFGEMHAGGKSNIKGLRCRISPTCTLSQNGYGDSQRLRRTCIAVKVRGLMKVGRGKNRCLQLAMQQRHLWDSNPRGQKHQNQCPSLRPPASFLRCRGSLVGDVVPCSPNRTQHNPTLPFLLPSMFSRCGEMCQHLDVLP